MKFPQVIALITGTALIVSACTKESEQTVAAVKENTNPLLAFVPADSAYVFANLESVPQEVSDAFVSRIQPVIDVISKRLAQFSLDYETGKYEGNQGASLATAILDELGGSVDSGSLGRLGISLRAHHAIYAIGAFPTARFELIDAQILRDAIARIETKMGTEIPVETSNGNAYWKIAEEGRPLGLYIAILDQQLAVSVFPVSAEDRLLASFLGQDLPAQSMASTNALATLNHEKGYTGYGSGIVDLQKLADELMKADSATHSYLPEEMSFELVSLDATCADEARAMLAKAPRFTAGTTILTTNEIAMRYELELESTLARGLAGLVSDTPIAEKGDQILTASLAVQVGKLRSFVLEKVNAVIAYPYQCDMLQELNRNAEQLATQLSIPMPPMVNNLNGIRISVDDFNPGSSESQGKGMLALHVDKPEIFVGMASMLIPGIDNLDLANQSAPVKIPSEMLRIPEAQNLNLFALMSSSGIGLSFGNEGAGELENFMSVQSRNEGTFFSVSYDSARQMALYPYMMDMWGAAENDTQSGDDFEYEFAQAIKQSYTSLLGDSRLDMSFTGNGLIIDNRIMFK